MELPLAQISPQGSHNTPPPTFTTFQPLAFTRKSCQGLLKETRLQTLQAGEPPFSPRAPDVHAAASPQAPGAASSQEDTGKAEEVPQEGGRALQAETRAWFQKTQARGLLQHGAAPPWFHGFITRREAERLLETQPQGCYLVRFSESAVTFVLTYRSRTCCRHFLLAQLRDGRHVVLGEDSAHARLQDLLRHYSGSPLSPYGETLSQPLARQTPEPAGLSLRTEAADAGSKSQDPHSQYSPVLKKEKPKALTQKEGSSEPKEPSQPPRPKPPVPAKPLLSSEAYTSPAPRLCRTLPCQPSNPIYHEPDEPIAFYAMGRGSPGEASSNIYAEVEVEVAVPSGGEGPSCILWHPVLRKCRSRPLPGRQNWSCFSKCPKWFQASWGWHTPAPLPIPTSGKYTLLRRESVLLILQDQLALLLWKDFPDLTTEVSTVFYTHLPPTEQPDTGFPLPGRNPGGQQLHSENSVAGQGPPVPRQPLPLWGHSLPHNLDRSSRTEERRGPP